MSRNKLVYRENSSIDRYGVFAAEDIQEGTRIVPYTGRILPKSATKHKPNCDYLFELNKRFDIDGRNIARYINHSCDPNCEARSSRGQIWIIALRDIRRDEELTYSYRYSFEEGLDYPCRCGTPPCPGFIMAEEDWPRLHRHKKHGTRKSLFERMKAR